MEKDEKIYLKRDLLDIRKEIILLFLIFIFKIHFRLTVV